MAFFVDRHTLEVTPAIVPSNATSIKNFQLISDTEYTQSQKLSVDCVGLFAPTLNPNKAIVFLDSELSHDFDPVLEVLKYSGVSYEELSDDSLDLLSCELSDISEQYIYSTCEGLKGRAIKKAFTADLNAGYFDGFINKWQLSRDSLKLSKTRGYEGTEYFLEIKTKEVIAQLLFFFSPADLFKIFGKNNYELIRQSKLSQFRSLRFLNPLPTRFLYTDEGLVQLSYELRDTMYRLPPVDRSLAGQSRAFKLSAAKLDVENRQLSDILGLDNPDQIKTNMNVFRTKKVEEFIKYNAADIFATAELDKTQAYFLNELRSNIGLDPTDIADTTGKNVSQIIVDLVNNHFGISDDQEKTIKTIYKLSQGKNLQSISSNHFGIQPFLTVGGLLYSRMSLTPYVEGNLGDLDLKSCYASILSKLNVYFGEPITFTFRYKKYKPTLRDALELIKSENAPKDAWFVRVSGDLEKAVNTLVMSDLRFKPRRELIPDKNNISLNRRTIGLFNAEKTSKKQAVSTVLLKQIKFGLINHNILEALKMLPDSWLQEYLDLKVDCVSYIPASLITNSLDEYLELSNSLQAEPESEELNLDKKALVTETRHYKNNVVLKFPISEYWNTLRTKRNQFKKEKNPIQEVFKIVQNSGYGALACMYLTVNNLLASNMITAAARTNAWLMVNALNGFSPITDGTCFSWDTIPYEQSFKEVLAADTRYLNHYNPDIKSGLDPKECGESWVNNEFKKHLSNFYKIPLNHELIELFDYELKTENFLTAEGEKSLESWKQSINYIPTSKEINDYLKSVGNAFINTDRFTWYLNSNGANYVKGMSKSTIMIDGNEYNFNGQSGQIKARSYSSKRDNGLLPWYVSSLKDGYNQPYIYEEDQVIKFGEGNDLAIKFLKDGVSEIAHPMGFTKKSVKLMKLVTRSQFLFLNESQLRNFETNEESLANLSKLRVNNNPPLLSKTYFEGLTNENLEPYGVEMRDHIDYYHFSRNHSVGIGFELLAFSNAHKGSIKRVRESISNKIDSGEKNFNAALQIKRSLKYAEGFKELLAVAIIKKANYEDDLKNVLVKSANEPTVFTVTPNDVFTLAKLWGYSDDD